MAVAYSGGRDSTALLHAVCAVAGERQLEVVALHVHHGLAGNADLWREHCRAQCEGWASSGVPVRFLAACLDPARRRRSESIEAWARRERYRALAALAEGAGAPQVLLAHHRRDQGETLLLQALRGGGVRGLAAMPADVVRDGIRWRRPWLARSFADIDRYVRLHRLEHIVDDSNVDRRYGRNRLRLDVWPALAQAFPAAERALAASAAWLQASSDLHEEIAALDLADATAGKALRIAPWLGLSAARRSNALRAWMRGAHGLPMPASLTTRLLTELPGRRSGRWPAEGGELRLHDGCLAWIAMPEVGAPAWAKARPAPRELRLAISSPGRYAVPAWGGTLVVEPALGDDPGLSLASLAGAELRPRRGGERFRWAANRPSRSLKKQFQEAGVSAWDRDGPLVYAGDTLLFVPGLGIEGGALVADRREPRVRLAWVRSVSSAASNGESGAAGS